MLSPEIGGPAADPAVEYEQRTGRSAAVDGLLGLVVALPAYLDQWLRTSMLSLLRELDRGLDRKSSLLKEMTVEPVAPWASAALAWWVALAKLGLSWPQVERLGHIPRLDVLEEILSHPPLRRTCASFRLARAMNVAGYVVSRGLAHEGFPGFVRDAVADAFRACGIEVGDPGEIPMRPAVQMMEATRATVASARAQARKRAPKAGRHVDRVQMAFVRSIRWARPGEAVNPAEAALLAAAAGLEPIGPGGLGKAAKRWGARLKRLGKVGPAPVPPAGAPPLKRQ
jgi:hypothetical protein